MKRLLFSTAMASAAVALTACGASDGAVGSAPAQVPAAAHAQTVSVMAAGGMGNILVDSSGMALYTPDQEADGTVHCVAACLSYWIPLAPGASTPTSLADGTTLGVITRPDGTQQVTTGGRPLYTFAMDAAGKVTGDGAADSFADQHFTWHVVHADGTTVSPSAGSTPPATSGGGYRY